MYLHASFAADRAVVESSDMAHGLSTELEIAFYHRLQ
jgi:hypothetical protein